MPKKNMPGRVNKRRQKALSRLESLAPASDVTKAEIATLKRRIMPDNEARSIKTKKDRRGRAKL